VSRRIALCAHVDIYGVVGSAMLAEELQGRLYRIGVPANAWSEVHSGLTSAAIQDSDAVAIGISTTGRTEETIEMLAQAGRAGAFTVAITNDPTSSLAELADRRIVTSIYDQFRQPDDLSAKHGQLLVLDLLYLLVAQENFDRSSAKLAASALAVSSHRRPRRTPPRAAVAVPGASRDGYSASAQSRPSSGSRRIAGGSGRLPGEEADR
jgi:DNA-binding MurR/RpiR family transcriptional regulator